MSTAAVQTWGWLCLLFPLVGTLVIALGWRVLPGRSAGWLGSAFVGLSFVASIFLYFEIEALPHERRHVTSSLFDYVSTSGFHAGMEILVDPLAVFMALVVSGVSFLIHVYSVTYMASDRGYVRFFSYLNYFVFSMLLLVLAGNFVLLIVGWAFVGAASYLLISFWYRRTTATRAGIKAFVMNVIGDVGLVLAVFLLFKETGALDYAGVFTKSHEVFAENDATLVIACLLLLVGAFAKSGQLPLHTWLPDAMEGPTPVSALIHAATMVTAGVYLIARMFPLFEHAPAAADVGAIVGTLTLVFAATVALAVTDFKRIIAYSTISQIGYMVLGVASAAYASGLFHLMTHAFFKALLFMGAGSVVSALGLTNASIDRLSGFRRALPLTFVTFTVGAAALAGLPVFAGFWSKDEIVSHVLVHGGLHTVLGVVAVVAAGLTAVYAFRMVFRVFFGDPVPEARSLIEEGEQAHGEHVNPNTGEEEDTDVGFPGPEHHVAERSGAMSVSMVVLAVLAAVGGLVAIPGLTAEVEHFLEPTFASSKHIHEKPAESFEWTMLLIGALVSIAGVAIAWAVWARRPGTATRLRERFAAVHAFLANKWYFDELYEAVFVRPTAALGRFGRTVVERAFVQGTLVDGTTGVVRAGSTFARAIQSGYLRAYALLLLLGLAALGLYFLLAAS